MRSALAAAATALLAIAAHPREARGEPDAENDRNGVVVLTAQGASFSLGQRRVVNAAPPMVELRGTRRLLSAPWLVPDASLGLLVFPEAVPFVGLGLRAHPLARVSIARHLFARVATQALAVVDGFDLALGGELGAAVERGRLIGHVGVSADRYLVGPRLLLLARLGVGVTF